MAAVVGPTDTLTLFWGVLIPILPLVFLVAPGAWRNVCPLAALNQASRNLGVSRAATAPRWFAEYGYVIASGTFVAIVIGRKIWFNDSGPALAIVLGVVAVGAAIGGWLLKGKSGWCSSICPLLPVQRVYGQTPFIGVPNSHCRPCVGCTKNCYDFNPRVAYVADMHDPDEWFRGYRRLFVAGFPGLVQGFFVVPDVGTIGVGEMLGRLALWVAASVALFVVLDTYLKMPANRLPVLAGAVAFSLFYFHTASRLPTALHSLFGGDWAAITWPLRIATIIAAAVWVVRSFRVEGRFLAEVAPAQPVRIDLGRAKAALDGDNVEVAFGDTVVVVPQGTTLLEAAETAGVPIEAGCRQGVCGADPVAIIDGSERAVAAASGGVRHAAATRARRSEPDGVRRSRQRSVLGFVDGGQLSEAETRRADVPAGPRTPARRHRRQRHRGRDHRRLPPSRPPPACRSTSSAPNPTTCTTAWGSPGWSSVARRCRVCTCFRIAGTATTRSRRG